MEDCTVTGRLLIFRTLTLVVVSTLTLTAPVEAKIGKQTALYSFKGSPDGANPNSPLTSDGAGNLYGTTYGGGLGYGIVFELSPNDSGGWNEIVLYSFTGGADGANPANPHSNVIRDGAGNLYGTTSAGGANGYGTVFELSPGPSWTESVLHSFTGGADGANPLYGVIADGAGDLYGITSQAGDYGEGTVFGLSPSGGGWTEQAIYSPEFSNFSGLVLDTRGIIFFTANYSVLELSPNGSGGWNLTNHPVTCVVHHFCGVGGPLLIDQYGDLYGTGVGYNNETREVYGIVGELSFEQSEKYDEVIFRKFADDDLDAGIVFDSGGNIYGTTNADGKYGMGTVFELTPGGKIYDSRETLWNFDGTNGRQPNGSLILDGTGNLYATASLGGLYGYGVAFKLTP